MTQRHAGPSVQIRGREQQVIALLPLDSKTDPLRAQRVNGAIVAGLTIACTLLALYDLFLLVGSV